MEVSRKDSSDQGKNIYKDHEGMREKDQFRELIVILLLLKCEVLKTE